MSDVIDVSLKDVIVEQATSLFLMGQKLAEMKTDLTRLDKERVELQRICIQHKTPSLQLSKVLEGALVAQAELERLQKQDAANGKEHREKVDKACEAVKEWEMEVDLDEPATIKTKKAKRKKAKKKEKKGKQ
jgi:hypothetical protein